MTRPDLMPDGPQTLGDDTKPTTFDEAAFRVAHEVSTVVVSKQHDYGHTNIDAFGQLGILVRLSDKIARLRNLVMSGEEPSNESVRETFVDIAGYGLIGMMWEDDTFHLPLAPTPKLTIPLDNVTT